MSVEQYLDVINPESHCTEDHDHYSLPPDWPSWQDCDWQKQLDWALGDHGFNEGADAAAAIAAEIGFSIPANIAQFIGAGLGNVWDRCNMMYFAKDLAKTGNVEPAISIALLSQWHNCHAFKCLLAHLPEVGGWLLG